MSGELRKIVFGIACVLLGGCGKDSGRKAFLQGKAAFKEKNYTATISHLSRAARRISDSPELYYYLGSAQLAKGEMEAANTAFMAALELKPNFGEALAGLGQTAYYAKDIEQAQVLFEKALNSEVSSDKTTANVLNGLALVEAERKNNSLARLYLLQAQRIDSTYAPTFYNLATLYRDAYQLHEEALDYFEMSLRLVESKSHYREKAQNNIKRLRLNIERLNSERMDNMRRDPTTAAKLLQAGLTAQNAKQLPRAAKHFKDALAADPMAFHAALSAAMVNMQLGQRQEAMEAFKKAAEINPSHQESYRQAAEIAIRLNRFEEAEKLLDRAIARSPFTPYIAEMMVRVFHAQRRFAEARSYGEFYLSLMDSKDQRRAAYEQWINSLPLP